MELQHILDVLASLAANYQDNRVQQTQTDDYQRLLMKDSLHKLKAISMMADFAANQLEGWIEEQN